MSTPYLYNSRCIACEEPNFWNENAKQCQWCPDTFVYQKLSSRCVCPTAHPYLYNGTCI